MTGAQTNQERMNHMVGLVRCDDAIDSDQAIRRIIGVLLNHNIIPKVSFPVEIKHIEVMAFAKDMDDVLTKNDNKGGWKEDNCTIEYLQHRLVEEMGEYFRSLEMNVNPSWKKRELLDIANFCMMLWDRS